MTQIPPHRRPQYPPTERMAILELKAARSWSLEQTAKAFLVTAATIASWMKRLDEEGPDALVQLRHPVNRFPEFVRYIVQRLRQLSPTLGKVKIAQTLARAGLHLGATTIDRMLKEEHRRFQPPEDDINEPAPARKVTARHANHTWHVDLTTVPIGLGYWCPWFPFALPQCWPFCWWVAVVVDHFSRRAMGVAAFQSQPSSEAVRAFLGRAIAAVKKAPRYIICDRGKQFDCAGFRAWCKRKGIKPPRYGAIGKHGSIAVVERFILTLKTTLSSLTLISFRREAFQRELAAITEWYNSFPPHTWLGGKTPDEKYHGRRPANRKPSFEPRSRWPRGSPCAKPHALVRAKPGVRLALDVSFYAGRKHLPIIRLRRAA
ncbi:MAG: DDE-type integrase/transposase/recombinase [Thermoguttaceae bacterium]